MAKIYKFSSKLLKIYESLILKVKNIQADQVSDLQGKSKRASGPQKN